MSNRKDRSWLQNKDQRKNNKVFSVMMKQNNDGSFTMIGGENKVFSRVNQHSGEWVNVDTRDLASELRSNPIHSL